MIHRFAGFVLIGVSAWALPAAAQSMDETKKNAARELGTEGIQLYEAGDYAQAVDRLQRAYQVLPAPTLGLWLARSLEKTGKMVEASELYNEVARMKLDPGASAAFKQAKADAERERSALQPRIPRLLITVEGSESAEVSVDGNALESALLGIPLPVNPGKHDIHARSGALQAHEEVIATEGEQTSVTLRLSDPALAGGAPSQASAGVPSSGSPSGSSRATPAIPPDEAPGSSQQTLGWVAVGVGAAGLVVGGAYFAIASGKKSDLEAAGCVDSQCPVSLQSDVDSFNQANTISKIGLGVGGVGIGLGAVLLLTAPKDGAEAASVQPWIGVGRAGVKGAF